jgi:hypothetical protein
VPNAEDGVAGVTQDAVQPGEGHTYRFVARQRGTYWYHSHQVSHEQVIGGLLGALVVRPRVTDPSVRDVVAVAHTYDGIPPSMARRRCGPARPGQRVRVRVVNSDNGPTQAWASAPLRVVAVDGTDVHDRPRSTAVQSWSPPVAASTWRWWPRRRRRGARPGRRHDVGQVGGAGVEAPEATQPTRTLDLLSYGSPVTARHRPRRRGPALHLRDRATTRLRARQARYLVDGQRSPLPRRAEYVVEEGDVVRVRITNSSGQVHPMHLHGHHAVVLPATG